MRWDAYLELELEHLEVLDGLVKHRSLVSLQGRQGRKSSHTRGQDSKQHPHEQAATPMQYWQAMVTRTLTQEAIRRKCVTHKAFEERWISTLLELGMSS